jgi:hypothetical protein
MKMKRKLWTAALCLGLMTLVGGHRLSAADKALSSAEVELKAKMKAEGWKEITMGVYERQRGPGKVEHLGYGREGFAWTLADLTRQHDELLKEYQSYPSADLYKVIDRLSLKIADAGRELRNAKSLSSVSAAVTGPACSICYSATADAYPLSGTSAPGVGAIADASFNSSCGYSGDTYAYAYARATLGSTTTTHTVEDPHTGTSVTSHASATASGTSNCSSTANSYAQSTALGISYSTSDSNTSCPAPPLSASISGPTSATVVGYGSQTVTWSASVSGGTAPYSYSWTINSAGAGTVSSTSATYYGSNFATSQAVSVALTVTDANSQTATASFSTTIYYTHTGPGGGDPCNQFNSLIDPTQPCN